MNVAIGGDSIACVGYREFVLNGRDPLLVGALDIYIPGAGVQTVVDSVSFSEIGISEPELDQDYSLADFDSLEIGFLGKLVRKAKKVGRSKLIKKVGKAAKGVIRSKITGAALVGLSVAAPGVGASALAAYYAANKALDALEKGKAAAKAGKRVAQQLGIKVSTKRTKSGKKRKVRRTKRKPTKAQAKVLKRAAKGAKVYKSLRAKIRKLEADAQKQGKAAAKAKRSLRILKIAAAARKRGATRGYLVTEKGKIQKGAFSASA